VRSKVLNSIIVLFCISGVYVIYTLVAVFFIIPLADFYWLAYSIDFLFFASALSPFWLFSWSLLIVLVGLAVIDFLCSFYIFKGSKNFMKVAFYRSLVSCLIGIFLVIVGLYVLLPRDLQSILVITDGGFYFLYYGLIFFLLMIYDRRSVG